MTRDRSNLLEDILSLLYSKDNENKIEHVVCLDFTEKGGWLILYRNVNGGYKLSGTRKALSWTEKVWFRLRKIN